MPLRLLHRAYLVGQVRHYLRVLWIRGPGWWVSGRVQAGGGGAQRRYLQSGRGLEHLELLCIVLQPRLVQRVRPHMWPDSLALSLSHHLFSVSGRVGLEDSAETSRGPYEPSAKELTMNIHGRRVLQALRGVWDFCRSDLSTCAVSQEGPQLPLGA